MSFLKILSCGSGTSLQDGGRFGFQRFGVGESGALDASQLFAANTLVGNGVNIAGIEFLILGGKFKYEGSPRLISLVGGAKLNVSGVVVPDMHSVLIKNDDIFEISVAKQGVTSILAIEGGFDLLPMLGSLSYHQRGMLGVKCEAGMTLPLGGAFGGEACSLPILSQDKGEIGVVLGPQADYFTDKGIETFFTSEYKVSREADRMGYRLEGAKIEHSRLGFNIVSDGIATGSIQVPGSGEPIVMMKDHQTTGGYPKIATVISTDLGRFSQLKAGEAVRFKAFSQEEAISLARKRTDELKAWGLLKAPLKRVLTSEFLLEQNLIGGFIS